MGLTDFRSIFCRYRVLWHTYFNVSASSLAGQVPGHTELRQPACWYQTAAPPGHAGAAGHASSAAGRVSLQASTETGVEGDHSHSDEEVKMRGRTEAGTRWGFFFKHGVSSPLPATSVFSPNSDLPSLITKAAQLKYCYPFMKSFRILYAEWGITKRRVTRGTLNILN